MPRVSITIPGKTPQPYRFKLDRDKVTIGRNSDNDIIIDCPSVSSRHCTMERIKGGYILRDRQSTNGIRLDEEAMAIIDLRNHSKIRVGDVKFDYLLSDEELDDLDDEDFIPHAKKASEVKNEPNKEAKPKKKKPQANVVTTPARPVNPPPTLASNTQGNGFLFSLGLFVCGILALLAGLNNSYVSKQKESGREGEISLLVDMKEGRPAVTPIDEEDPISREPGE